MFPSCAGQCFLPGFPPPAFSGATRSGFYSHVYRKSRTIFGPSHFLSAPLCVPSGCNQKSFRFASRSSNSVRCDEAGGYYNHSLLSSSYFALPHFASAPLCVPSGLGWKRLAVQATRSSNLPGCDEVRRILQPSPLVKLLFYLTAFCFGTLMCATRLPLE